MFGRSEPLSHYVSLRYRMMRDRINYFQPVVRACSEHHNNGLFVTENVGIFEKQVEVYKKKFRQNNKLF